MIAKPTSKSTPTPKMALDNIKRGQVVAPHRVVIYGAEGVGKTTFAASAPSPVILGTEDGSGALDVPRFPRPDAWSDVLDAVRVLTDQEHDFKTLVIDSLDWLEPLLWAHVCQAHGKPSIEEFGFGRGYVEALQEARRLLAALELLQSKRAVSVVLIAHATLRKFANPAGEDWDRWTMKVNEKLGGTVREWADTVLFATWEQHAVELGGKTKGVSTGRRIVQTTKTAAFDAKNRFALPDSLELSWASFAREVERNRRAPQEIRALLKDDAEKLAKFEAWIAVPRPIHEVCAMRDRIAEEIKP